MIRGQSGQTIGAQLVSASDGSAFTGSVTVYVTGDGGTQAVGQTGSGSCAHEGNGLHTYQPTASETDYAVVAFTFVGTGAVPATVQVFTEAASASPGDSSDGEVTVTPTGDELQDAIADAAVNGVKRMRTDAGEVEAHSIPDQIAAAKFAAAQEAQRRRRTVRLIRVLPPGAV